MSRTCTKVRGKERELVLRGKPFIFRPKSHIPSKTYERAIVNIEVPKRVPIPKGG
jgi:hypothetical protein